MTSSETFTNLVTDATLDLPTPGAGCTAQRHLALFTLARTRPVSVARLAEAHTDAIAILHEAQQTPVADAAYGVWASNNPTGGVVLEGQAHDAIADASTGPTISGSMPFASGLGIIDRALITVTDPSNEVAGAVLIDVDVQECDTIAFDTSQWFTPALADAATGSITFDNHPIDAAIVVGNPGWYLDRVGFWHGACGPAACWAGAAAGLIDAAEALVDDNPHRRAHLGAMRSSMWALQAVLRQAGEEIDQNPHDAVAAQIRARSLRHQVERTVADVLDRFGRAFGPRPFAHDQGLNQRWLDTHLYCRQDHAERDLEALGQLAAGNHDA